MVMEKETMLSVDVRLGNIVGSNVVKVASGARNYALYFYLAQANLERTRVADTTVYQLTNIDVPALDFGLVAMGAASSPLTFTTSGTLPKEQCNKYVWFCVCVVEGMAAAYTDSDKTNNCKCRAYSEKISCYVGRWSAPT
jgi:hypothetical protein